MQETVLQWFKQHTVCANTTSWVHSQVVGQFSELLGAIIWEVLPVLLPSLVKPEVGMGWGVRVVPP